MGSAPFINAANQVLPTPGVSPWRNQMNFAQIIGAIGSENPDIDPSDIQVQVNSIVRDIYDRRTWSGLFIRGQIATVGFTIGGSVSVAQGSTQVIGAGTAWTPAVVGQQFRLGYNTPPMTITACNPFTQVLTIEMPWASTSTASAGYFIAQYYYSIGSNIKYIHTAKNMLMAWRLRLDYNQQTLDTLDSWRSRVFMPTALVQMPSTPNGDYQVELWPVPSIVQAIPWTAYCQPPNLVNDSDALPPAIRADIVVDFGRAWAKTYRGPKWNKYYDAAEGGRLRQEANHKLMYAAKADEDLYRQSIIYPEESMREAPDLLSGGRNATWDFNHGVMAGEGNSEWG
jgi:hypothetical protein